MKKNIIFLIAAFFLISCGPGSASWDKNECLQSEIRELDEMMCQLALDHFECYNPDDPCWEKLNICFQSQCYDYVVAEYNLNDTITKSP